MVTSSYPAQPSRGAERRQVTVLFCDLVGSTALASSMDPEDHHDLMVVYQRYCALCIEEAGGFVARYSGDGVLAYFGYPIALEDAPERAVHAGLRLRVAGQYLPKPEGKPLAVRIGIATGLVVVGDLIGSGSAEERAIAGETPNLAARLQTTADPNTIHISDTTKQLTDALFAFRSRGSSSYKGFLSPIPSWEVVTRRPVIDRFGARRLIGVTPMVGREQELNQLLEAWSEVKLGERRVIGLVGPPGLGKSRLIEETRRQICRQSVVIWLDGGGASVFANAPFHLLTQLIPQMSAEAVGNSETLRLYQGQLFGRTDEDRTSKTIENLLGRMTNAGSTEGEIDAANRRTELLRLVAQWLRSASERASIVLVVEDLQWVDPSSLEFLDFVVRDNQIRRLLFLYTSRTDFTGRWPVNAQHQVLALNPLDRDASAKLARATVNNRFSFAQVDAVVSRTSGVPLYIEELARLIAGQDRLNVEATLPANLADLLAARLEELGPAKRYAQVAAVLGAEFSVSLFSALIEQEGVDPAAALGELRENSVIIPGKNSGGESYVFRHALIATAAYEALLKRERRQLHGRAARLILDRYPTLEEAQPQLLARHWTVAGDARQALAAWEKAGDRAHKQGAFREAEHDFRHALAVLQNADNLPESEQSELRIAAKLNRVLQITQGYSAAEAARASQRVRELAVKAGNLEALVREERAKWRSVFTAGDYAQADLIAENVMSLTAPYGDVLWRRTFRLRAGIQHGFYTGDLTEAERDFLQWKSIQDDRHRGSGDDVLSMGIAALVAHMTGRQVVAEKRIRAAFEIADGRGNAYDQAMALHTQTCLHHFSHEVNQQANSAKRLAEVARESGFEYAAYLAMGWLALASINAGRAGDALEQVSGAISGFERLGARVSMVFWLTVLARSRQLNGDFTEALRTYSEALTFNRQERVFRVEACLERAHLWTAMGEVEKAERDIREGIHTASVMHATSFQLRALTDLGRLQLTSGNSAKRQRTLRSIRKLLRHQYCPAVLADAETLLREAGESMH